ncbi:MAG: PLP-dependent aspartate aminotransferase family protein [Pseudobdellovibrionaceae bacterium]
MSKNLSLETRCVHLGEVNDAFGSPHTPIYNTTTFGFKSTADILDVVEGRKSGPLYSRYGLNPSILSIEEKLAGLEGAEAALVFSSGMAAEAALFMALGRKGVICLGDAYGGTLELISQQLPQIGIKTHMLLGKTLDRLEGLLKEGAGIVFFETPTNPNLEIFHIRTISDLAHKYGAIVAVDNTFASPVNQQPLRLGADVVIHSATKYLGGHSDITAGAMMGRKELLQSVWPWRKNLGQTPSPEVAALLSRSLKTLSVRVRQQNESAMFIAKKLSVHPKIAKVLYPGLEGFPQLELARAQMSGFGGMITIETKGKFEDAAAFCDHLNLFTIAPSLGGTESLVTMPVTTTHHGLGREERLERGITDTTVRISNGLESKEDLLNDLLQSLDR